MMPQECGWYVNDAVKPGIQKMENSQREKSASHANGAWQSIHASSASLLTDNVNAAGC